MQKMKEIRAILDSIEAHPRKRFGQCFLIDLQLMEKVVEMGMRNISPDSTVLEVGPGTGSLTEELLARAKKVVAVEIDRDLGKYLETAHKDNPDFTLIIGDALGSKSTINPDVLAAVAPEVHLVANLPYNIATPLIANCLIESWKSLTARGVRFSSLTFTVQQEVAQRFTAKPNTNDYGIVSVLIKILGEVQLGKVIPPGAFWPRPKIDSQLVRIDFVPEKAERLVNIEILQQLTRTFFTHRRKRIAATVKFRDSVFSRDQLDSALRATGINPDLRAAELSPEDYLKLANILSVNE